MNRAFFTPGYIRIGHRTSAAPLLYFCDDRLDQAAMEAIRKWTFNPAVRDAQKVAAWTSVRVKFQLQTASG